MARSPRKSTAGSGTSAAKKTTAKKTTGTKATGTKATGTKTTATKGAAKKGATAPGTKKGTAKRAPATKRTTRKAPTRKDAAAPASLVVKADEDAWTTAELDEVLGELHGLRDRLVAELRQQEDELADLMRNSGDGAGQDQADLGYTSFERDHELTVVHNSRDMLAQVDRALARIADGSYGLCESCGNPIGKMRLMAFPRATLCMSCKQREERR